MEKAVQEYGSLEKYAEAMKEHTQAFLENGPSVSQEEAKELADQTDALTRQLTEDLTLNAASPEVQEKLKKLIVSAAQTGTTGLFWQTPIFRIHPFRRQLTENTVPEQPGLSAKL